MRHETVKAALFDYYAFWQTEVNSLATEIENLGANTGQSAVHVADSDDESTTILSTTAAVAVAANGELAEPLDVP